MRSKLWQLATLFTLSLVLSACGGGGSSFGLATGNNTSGSSTDSSGSTTTTSSTLDLGSGVANGFTSGAMDLGIGTSNLPFGGSTTVTVNIIDTGTGSLSTASNTVTFTSNCAVLGKATVTDSVTTTTGIATATYDASTCETSDTVTAKLSGTTTTATATITIDGQTTGSSGTTLALGSGSGSSFVSGTMTSSVGSGTMSFGGSATVSVNIVDSSTNALFTTSTAVSFTSACVSSGQATIDSTAITTTGTATATYTAGTCQTSDTVTATLADGTSASVTINIGAQTLGFLEFTSASPNTIALKGSGTSSLPESSTLTFKLLDTTKAPISGATVNYSLSSTIGGISLSNSSSVTSADGSTFIALNSGTVNTSVNVTATVSSGGTTIATTSTPVAVVGSVPDENSFSLAFEVLNPRGWNFDGTEVKVTARAADRFNNPAPDGTRIAFVTDGGAIGGSCELKSGSCSVLWTSQNPRPADGVVNILARTTGEESFVDTNGNGMYDNDPGESFIDANSNGVYDSGESFTDTNGNGRYDGPESFIDLAEAFNDENGTTGGDPSPASYNSGEFFSDFDGDGVFNSSGNGLYDGTGCSSAAQSAGNCATLTEVRESGLLCMSSDDVIITSSAASLSVTGTNEVNFTVTITDINGISPAKGTQVEVSTDNGSIVSGANISIPNNCSVSGDTFSLRAKGDGTSSSGNITIKVTRVDQVEETLLIPFSD